MAQLLDGGPYEYLARDLRGGAAHRSLSSRAPDLAARLPVLHRVAEDQVELGRADVAGSAREESRLP